MGDSIDLNHDEAENSHIFNHDKDFIILIQDEDRRFHYSQQGYRWKISLISSRIKTEDSIFLSQVEEDTKFLVQMLPSCNWQAKFFQPVVTRKKYAV